MEKVTRVFHKERGGLEVVLKRKNYITFGETHCWKSHQTNWKYTNIVVLKKKNNMFQCWTWLIQEINMQLNFFEKIIKKKIQAIAKMLHNVNTPQCVKRIITYSLISKDLSKYEQVKIIKHWYFDLTLRFCLHK